MQKTKLRSTCEKLVAKGKGILAADESTNTIAKRFAMIDLPSTEDNRRDYRELLFTAPSIEDYISGVILFDETIWQRSSDGRMFTDILRSKNICVGIKVDAGVKPMHADTEEALTHGLEGLGKRLHKYRQAGASFAKWRAVIKISDVLPTDACIHKNMQALARYASVCQQEEIVPIVEPEVLMDGKHNIERCYAVTRQVLASLYDELRQANVCLYSSLLKPNMVIAAKDCPNQADSDAIASYTVRCCKETVDEAVPGIVFLSGGQSEEQATMNLGSIFNAGKDCPWAFSFSYGRALQESALRTWQGKNANVAAAQQVFIKRCQANSRAIGG
ncbi:MAG: fructose-bisphosphate aldolase class I [Pseudomonadota bacterium]|nr:fructose-bisphosphate aldolase class I [Pseudomonadota bacterium]